ncbi:MAG: Hsp20/alpha crystallin family protein [Chloroflexi bacterium]|nr:Hsp20/alpha crystallin family protein [Chloroflexota bacterium]
MMVRPTSSFGELIALRRAVERMFDDPFFRPVATPRTSRASRRLALDVLETGDSLVLEAALPGIRPDEVDISVEGDVLTISAGSDTDTASETEGVRVREIRRGRVSRSVTLPQGVDASAATATFENGLLRLAIPKAQPVERVRIPVTTPIGGQVEVTTAPAVEAGEAPAAPQGADGSDA